MEEQSFKLTARLYNDDTKYASVVIQAEARYKADDFSILAAFDFIDVELGCE